MMYFAEFCNKNAVFAVWIQKFNTKWVPGCQYIRQLSVTGWILPKHFLDSGHSVGMYSRKIPQIQEILPEKSDKLTKQIIADSKCRPITSTLCDQVLVLRFFTISDLLMKGKFQKMIYKRINHKAFNFSLFWDLFFNTLILALFHSNFLVDPYCSNSLGFKNYVFVNWQLCDQMYNLKSI